MTDDIGLAGTRELNRLRVMQALLRNPGSSRNDVARLTGLSRPTVSTLVDELESAGMVHQHAERDDQRPRPTGRPPMYVSLAPDAAFAVGLDFGHTHIRAGRVRPLGRAGRGRVLAGRGRPRARREPRSRARARAGRAARGQGRARAT